MKLDKNKISLVNNYFRNKPVMKAYLFGSYAREDADRKSDVDILVELDYSKKIGLEFVGMKLDLEEILNRSVDLVSSKALSKHIRPFVEMEKVLIYEK